VAEYRLFDPADPPAWLDPEWWRDTPNCDHLGHPAGVHRARLEHVARLAADVARREQLDWITDIGAGDGALLSLLPAALRRKACGFEIITNSVKVATEVRGVEVRQANVLVDEIAWGAPTNLVIATEVLEHLADPHGFMRDVLARNADWLIVSSPWRETADYHEDNHAWAWDRVGYRALVEQGGFEVVEHVDVEWSQVITAKAVRS